MRLRFIGIGIAAVGVVVLLGLGAAQFAAVLDDPVAPELRVTGDVREVLRASDSLEMRGRAPEVALTDLIRAAAPRSRDFSLLLRGEGGRGLLLERGVLPGLRAAVDGDRGWTLAGDHLSADGEISHLWEIVVISREYPPGTGIAVIDAAARRDEFTPGQLHGAGYRVQYVRADQGDGGDRSSGVTPLRRLRLLDPAAALDIPVGAPVWVVGERGSVNELREGDLLRLRGNALEQLTADGEVRTERVRGFVVEPPERQITDVYHDARRQLERGERVLLVLIDGLGHHQLLRAAEGGQAPHLSELPDPDRALVAYPPVTPVNVAASLTGRTPDATGIHGRDVRRPEVPTIFAFAERAGLRSAAVMGPIQPVDLEIDPVLCTDAEDTGSTDDDILAAALERVDDHDLLLVHFKDVDRAGHEYGDLAPETLEQIRRIDGYVGKLLAAWDGSVVIYADHGMHATEEGGDHGVFLPEDLIVPYWQLEGGERDE